jgi:hypothetical protein
LLLVVTDGAYWLLLVVTDGAYWLSPLVTGCYWMLLLNKSREGSGLRFMHSKAAARHPCHDGESVSFKMLFLQREENTILSPLLLFVVTSCYWLLLHVVTGCHWLLPGCHQLLLLEQVVFSVMFNDSRIPTSQQCIVLPWGK